MGIEVSKRSLALTFIGFFLLFQGLRVLEVHVSNPDLAIAHELYIPRMVRVWLWTLSGGLTILFAWSRNWQWVSVSAAVLMPVERVISYAFSFFHWLAPGPPSGSIWSIVDVGRWVTVTALIIVIAGWVEWDRAGGEADEH